MEAVAACFVHNLEGQRKIMKRCAVFVLDFCYQVVKINSRNPFLILFM